MASALDNYYDNAVLNAISYNNALQMASAERQMQFQQYNSDTMHTREVQDLKNAGLNPVLSANSGASTPNGAMAGVDTSASSYYINKMMAATQRYVSDNSLQGALVNAGAMIASASMNSAAAMYSANQHYNASVYSSDRAFEGAYWSSHNNYMATKYQTDHSHSGSWAGLVGSLINSANPFSGLGGDPYYSGPNAPSSGRYFGK